MCPNYGAELDNDKFKIEDDDERIGYDDII